MVFIFSVSAEVTLNGGEEQGRENPQHPRTILCLGIMVLFAQDSRIEVARLLATIFAAFAFRSLAFLPVWNPGKPRSSH